MPPPRPTHAAHFARTARRSAAASAGSLARASATPSLSWSESDDAMYARKSSSFNSSALLTRSHLPPPRSRPVRTALRRHATHFITFARANSGSSHVIATRDDDSAVVANFGGRYLHTMAITAQGSQRGGDKRTSQQQRSRYRAAPSGTRACRRARTAGRTGCRTSRTPLRRTRRTCAAVT